MDHALLGKYFLFELVPIAWSSEAGAISLLY